MARAKKKKRKSSKKKAVARKPIKEKKALKKSLAAQQAAFGKVMKKGGVVEANRIADLDTNDRLFVSTGSLELDRVLTPTWGKVGGIAMGRVTEVFAAAHVGKTTLLDHIFASVQRMSGVAILVETDTKRDPHYTQAIGVDTGKLEYIEFNKWDESHMENAMNALINSIAFWRTESPETPVIVGIDALGVTPTEEEVSKELGKKTTASAARILRQTCRKMAGVVTNTNCGVVLLNHEYSRIGPFAGKSVYGGQAVELLATIRLKLHRVMDGRIKDSKGVVLGNEIGYDLKKFKLGHADRQGRFAILHGVGIDNTWTVFDRLSKLKLIVPAGQGWSVVNLDGEVIKFQGFLGLRNKSLENPELFSKLVQIYRGTL